MRARVARALNHLELCGKVTQLGGVSVETCCSRSKAPKFTVVSQRRCNATASAKQGKEVIKASEGRTIPGVSVTEGSKAAVTGAGAPVKEHYTFWESADVLFKHHDDANARKTVVGRWDWHLWNLLLAVLPAGVIILFVKSADADLAAADAAEATKKAEEDEKRAAESAKVESATTAQAQMRERLAEVEALLKALQAKVNTSVDSGDSSKESQGASQHQALTAGSAQK
mmetsp:Transcript_11486/g.34508  ORF Transcript_11486/g.34508 Transcript_11486/m.34508 type:complete len:228 (+) Transcript_11486:87-770(+)